MVLEMFLLAVILRRKFWSFYIFFSWFFEEVHAINHLIKISGQGRLLHGRYSETS